MRTNLPRFVRVTVPGEEEGEKHVLPPEQADAPAALCLLARPEPDWSRHGFTRRLYEIGCDGCRERASEVIANWQVLDEMEGAGGPGPAGRTA